MTNVSQILSLKGSVVHTVSAESTVLDAARRMNTHRIGALVVVDDKNYPVGMFTERDILTRIVAEERAPATTKVRDVMTTRVLTCSPETSPDQLRHTMRQERVRHIPVMDNGQLVGMVSIGDLNTAEVKVLCQTIEYLEQYSIRS